MKRFTCMLAIMAVAAFTSVTVAQDEAPTCQCPSQQALTSAVADQEGECSKCPGTCDTECCDKETAVAVSTQEGEVAECQECPVSVAMASLPKMTYKVGEEATCCSESAAVLAEESGEAIHCVVGEEDTCCEMTARLTAATLQYKAAVQATLAEATPVAPAVGPEAAPLESTETGSGT